MSWVRIPSLTPRCCSSHCIFVPSFGSRLSPAAKLDVRAASLQLGPEVPAWRRIAEQGCCVPSLSSSAARHRRPSRRPPRVHPARPQTVPPAGRPAAHRTTRRIAADLLTERTDPQAVGQLVTDAIQGVFDYPGTFAQSLAPHASQLGLRKADGLQRQMAYDRLLERLHQFDDGWIVRGATALPARDLGMRATIDIDVYQAPPWAQFHVRLLASRDVGPRVTRGFTR
jgi:hypothetical protein